MRGRFLSPVAAAMSGSTGGGGSAPVNTGLPAISGTTTYGSTLTCSDGTWTGSPAPTYTYQWKRAGADISGETGATYAVVAADVGASITCAVTATNASGSASATSAGVTPTWTTDTDASAYIAAMSVAPTVTRAGLIKDLIAGLKTDGLWANHDLVYLIASHDSQAARLNAKAPATYALSAVNSPVFTVDRGYAGDGVSSYLDTGFADNTAAVNWSQDSASMAVWLNQHSGTANAVGVNGTTATRLIPRGASALDGRIHGTTGVGGTVADGLGLTAISRTSSTALKSYRNGANMATASATSAAPVAGAIQIFRGSAGSFGAGRAAAVLIGAGLNDAQETALYNRLNTFLTAIGAA